MLRDALISMAEEDYYGLWESVWRLRSMLPRCGESELRNIARQTIHDLLKSGKIVLFRRYGIYGNEEPIPPTETDAILADDVAWNEPSGKHSTQILFGSP